MSEASRFTLPLRAARESKRFPWPYLKAAATRTTYKWLTKTAHHPTSSSVPRVAFARSANTPARRQCLCRRSSATDEIEMDTQAVFFRHAARGTTFMGLPYGLAPTAGGGDVTVGESPSTDSMAAAQWRQNRLSSAFSREQVGHLTMKGMLSEHADKIDR